MSNQASRKQLYPESGGSMSLHESLLPHVQGQISQSPTSNSPTVHGQSTQGTTPGRTEENGPQNSWDPDFKHVVMPIPIGMPQQFYEDETLRAGSWYNVGQWRAHANMSATGPIYRQLLYEQSDQQLLPGSVLPKASQADTWRSAFSHQSEATSLGPKGPNDHLAEFEKTQKSAADAADAKTAVPASYSETYLEKFVK